MSSPPAPAQTQSPPIHDFLATVLVPANLTFRFQGFTRVKTLLGLLMTTASPWHFLWRKPDVKLANKAGCFWTKEQLNKTLNSFIAYVHWFYKNERVDLLETVKWNYLSFCLPKPFVILTLLLINSTFKIFHTFLKAASSEMLANST